MKRLLLLALGFILLLTACAAEPPAHPDFTVPFTLEEKTEDLNALVKNLESKHKNLFAKISREQWESQVEDLRARLDGLDNAAFFCALSRLVALPGDAHTRIAVQGQLYNYLPFYAYGFTRFDQDWILSCVPPEYEAYLGEKVVKLNGRSMEEAVQALAPLVSHENDAYLYTQFSSIAACASALYDAGIGLEDGRAVVTIEAENGVLSELEFEAKVGGYTDLMLLQAPPAPTTPVGSYYWSMDLDNTRFIQYNRCAEYTDQPIKSFTKQETDAIRAGDYSKVIVDLRYNGGGSSNLFDPMIAELGKLREEKGFALYTLIGSHTFSSALLNAIDLKKEAGAVLVGSPTGGSPNHYGEFKSFTLPNAPFEVSYSTKYFERMPGYTGTSLLPDIPVELNYTDYMNGVDTVVEAVQALP